MDTTLEPTSLNDIEKTFWQMCVQRDIEAFLAQDWSITKNDFDAGAFLGIDAEGSSNPLDWTPKYPTLQSYSEEFAIQARDFAAHDFAEDPRQALYSALSLSSPRIANNRALIVKTFDGKIKLNDGTAQVLAWKSIFHLKQCNGTWLFTGFVGYLPLK